MKIAVIGAGLMGRLLCTRLYQEGFINISLFDQDDKDKSTSPANIAAGMLAPFCESVAGGELIYRLGLNSIPLWRQYLTNWGNIDLLNTRGTLLIAEPNFYAEIKHYIKKIAFYTNSTDYYQDLDGIGLQNLEAELCFNQAYFLPQEGALNAAATMKCLGNYLENKITWIANCPIHQLETNGNFSATGLQSEYGDEFDLIFDCRGIGATANFKNLRGVRGEIIHLHAPDVNITRPTRLFHPRHNIYIVPYGNNHYAVGATEIEALDFSPISVRSTLELLTCLYKVHSGFAEARIISSNTSCRPTLIDNLPQIKCRDKLIAINGLYRHGFLLAPSLVEEVITYLKTGTKITKEIWCSQKTADE